MLVKGVPGVNWVEMIWLKTSTPVMVVISDSDYNLLFVIYVSHYSSRSWWRHQMGTFSALLAFCAGNSPVIGEFPTQRPVTQSFDVFFDLHLNKRLGNNRAAGNLKRHRVHCDITVMWCFVSPTYTDVITPEKFRKDLYKIRNMYYDG